ncbi:MAG: hypothetical protein HWQ43_25685 [Nostoc sp. JL31]|uniref:hypothetical protein n=1 Tax=Nostoc sp. JL31 TaxID=2815395 RepID=UPI0025FD13ED|nr:hypothetical protein [Nostoc sp. JL31]MBN3892390.1 hypothetical protein [Nostoc sp. JL31]
MDVPHQDDLLTQVVTVEFGQWVKRSQEQEKGILPIYVKITLALCMQARKKSCS